MPFLRIRKQSRDRRSDDRYQGDTATECGGKAEYDSYSAAATAIGHMRKRGNMNKSHIYKCRFCTKWHIGQRRG